MNQNSKYLKQGSFLRWNKKSTQQQDQHWKEQKKSNSWTPVGPTKDRSSNPNQLR